MNQPVEMINIPQRLFVDADGFEYPIATFLDGAGVETAPDIAVFAVAGREGRWFTLNLSEFDFDAGVN